ncbi:hypothetical protein Q7P35_009793 [Cladosporium inversicolor]
MHTLAGAYLTDGRISQAIEIFEHVAQIEEKLAADDPDRLASQHELARAYFTDRRISQAIEIFEHVVHIREEKLAADDPDRLASQHELARAYFTDRRISQAIEIFEHVVLVTSMKTTCRATFERRPRDRSSQAACTPHRGSGNPTEDSKRRATRTVLRARGIEPVRGSVPGIMAVVMLIDETAVVEEAMATLLDAEPSMVPALARHQAAVTPPMSSLAQSREDVVAQSACLLWFLPLLSFSRSASLHDTTSLCCDNSPPPCFPPPCLPPPSSPSSPPPSLPPSCSPKDCRHARNLVPSSIKPLKRVAAFRAQIRPHGLASASPDTSTTLKSSPSGICDAFCTDPAQNQQVMTWYQTNCGNDDGASEHPDNGSGGQTTVVITSTSTSATPAAPTTATRGAAATASSGSVTGNRKTSEEGSWWDNHWKWIVMVIVLAIALAAIAILAMWLKKRHYRKRDDPNTSFNEGITTRTAPSDPKLGQAEKPEASAHVPPVAPAYNISPNGRNSPIRTREAFMPYGYNYTRSESRLASGASASEDAIEPLQPPPPVIAAGPLASERSSPLARGGTPVGELEKGGIEGTPTPTGQVKREESPCPGEKRGRRY